MPLKNSSNLHMPDARTAFLEEAAELFDKNSDRISNLAANAEDGKCRISFSLQIDVSENEPLIAVEISGGQRFKDKRARTLPNPNQTSFGFADGTNQPANIIDVSRNTETNGHVENGEAGKEVSFEQAKSDARAAQQKRKGRKKKEIESEATAE